MVTKQGTSLWDYTRLRLLQAVPLLFGIIIINFLLIRLAPGDPVAALVGDFPAPPEYVERVRAQFGLDRPVWQQLGLYIWNVLQGNLGFSFANQVPVLNLVLERLGRTLTLMASTIMLATVTGVILGTLAARRPHSFIDTMTTGFVLTGYAMPEFWMGQIVILIFAVWLRWLPSGGFRDARLDLEGLDLLLNMAKHLLLPMLVLSFRYMAITTRLTRATLLEVMKSEYILAARARGLSERRVFWFHGLRAAALPIVTIIGYNFSFVMAGSALVETVFAWPGVGRLMYTSILYRDYPVLLGILLLVSVTVVVVNLFTDLAYAFLDPRVRY